MAEADNQENNDKQNGLVNGSDAAAKKAAEANGTPMKDSSSVSMGDESDIPLDKRSRRRECIFIGIAILLGVALIAVLVYFSVANALKSDSPQPVGQRGGLATNDPTTSSTTTASTTTASSGFSGFDDPSSLMRNNPGALLRGLPKRGPVTTQKTTTTTEVDFDTIDRGSLLRGLPRRPIPQTTEKPTTTTEKVDLDTIDRASLLRGLPRGPIPEKTTTTTEKVDLDTDDRTSLLPGVPRPTAGTE